MDGQQDLGAIARAIIDANLYMTLGTVDQDGRPWVAPVFYAAAGYTQFYWISSPEVTHSRNLAQRPHVSIVVFDSRVLASTGQAVYMSAEAEELAGADLDHGVEVYPGPPERGGRVMAPEELRPPTACTARRCRSIGSCARVPGRVPGRVATTAAPTTIAPR